MPEVAEARSFGLAHHFESFEQQREASFLGVWIFLVTEIMFFGGLFTAYIVYRSANADAFAAASHHLDIFAGAFNTAVLIASSLTMALAVWAAQTARRRSLIGFLLATIVLGSTFLGVKVYEYGHKFEEHLVPGPGFRFAEPFAAQAEMFFNLYFAMTGLHALHMIVGVGLLLALVEMARRRKFTPDNHNMVEGIGLYWHFVDIVWIFLFPLLYLLGRSH